MVGSLLPSRMSALLALVAVIALLAVVASGDPRSVSAAGEPSAVVANINDDCIEGARWPDGASVTVRVLDADGTLLYTATARADSQGHFFVANNGTERCDIPVDLRPGLRVTASDGTTTKVLALERVTYDQLDPATDTGAGTAPPGRSVYVNLSDPVPAEDTVVADSNGDWSVDFKTAGGAPPNDVGPGDVVPGAMGDAWLMDGDADATIADHFVTAVSLGATTAAGAVSRGEPKAATTAVRRGRRVRLAGRLSAGTRSCVSGKRVTLLKVGARTRRVASTRTARTGRYSFTRKVNRTTRFRVRYAGSRRCQRSKSRIRTVRVTG